MAISKRIVENNVVKIIMDKDKIQKKKIIKKKRKERRNRIFFKRGEQGTNKS